MANDAFYLMDEKHPAADGSTTTLKDQLYFRTTIKSTVPEIRPNEFEGRATKEHVAGYSMAFSNFMEANPGYVLPWDAKNKELKADGQKVDAAVSGEKSVSEPQNLQTPLDQTSGRALNQNGPMAVKPEGKAPTVSNDPESSAKEATKKNDEQVAESKSH